MREIKELRRLISWIDNEINWDTENREPTNKWKRSNEKLRRKTEHGVSERDGRQHGISRQT